MTYTYLIRDAHAFRESYEVTTFYSMEEMVEALQSMDKDCGFVGEFMDKICGRDVHVESSDFISYKHDVLAFEADYYDVNDNFRSIEIRVLPVV